MPCGETMLRKEGVACFACPDLDSLSGAFERGAAAILVAEEALLELGGWLANTIARQPSWSDLPVLMLTRAGADSSSVTWAVSELGNVTLLERPVPSRHSACRAQRIARARAPIPDAGAPYHASRADRRKDEFLATLPMNWRNPLAPIRNSVNVLRLSGADESAGAICDILDRQINHMVRPGR